MAYIEVDIDIDEFDTDEIVEELIRRIKKSVVKKPTKDQIQKVQTEFAEMMEFFGFSDDNITVNTLDEKMKIEHLKSVWGKYTSADIERLLP